MESDPKNIEGWFIKLKLHRQPMEVQKVKLKEYYDNGVIDFKTYKDLLNSSHDYRKTQSEQKEKFSTRDFETAMKGLN